MKFVIISLLACTLAFQGIAQQKYWIEFNSKDTVGYDYSKQLSEATINNRKQFGLPLYQWSDVPVSAYYLKELNKLNIQIAHRSKWLNAVSACMTQEQVYTISALPFVKAVTPIDRNISITSTTQDVDPAALHSALMQMQSTFFTDQAITGKGVKIGVVDAGFYKANTEKYLEHLYSEFRIMAQRDFLDPSRKDIITEAATSGDGHGKSVLMNICGYDKDQRVQYGMAVNAQFYLARTENGDKEYRGEEDKWVEAMEWLDSLGIRLISTSLGYATKMDDPNDNYKQEDMNGNTTRITKAAQMAVDQKGIFLVVSAGNEGASAWRIISAPADAKGALSVGATQEFSLLRIGYSSVGPEPLPYLKPNVACYSPNGTSFSAPALTGFVACLMEKAPHLNNKQLKDIVEKSALLYPYGNNFIGYGPPQADRALKLIQDSTTSFKLSFIKEIKGEKVKYKFPNKINASGVIFHKKDEKSVLKQSELSIKKGKLKLKRPAGVQRSTIAIEGVVIEVIWK